MLALLASTNTNLYTNESYKQFIKMIALAILLLVIIYSVFNVTDYKNFIDRFNVSESSVYNMYTEGNIIIQYIFVVNFLKLILLLPCKSTTLTKTEYCLIIK